MRKNGSVTIGNTEMYYAAFGRGSKTLVVLPGLSDGSATIPVPNSNTIPVAVHTDKNDHNNNE